MSDNSERGCDRPRVKYCVDCGWFTSEQQPTEGSSSRAAIRHFLETGHTIESIDTVPPPPLSTRQ
ncbi:hypothetical protein [Natrononativus amylolyticus]|uniref:hypothetical protein n=1 Tax=Natrononativus amylolyticus TaxID=2963434 RepID=UPI0020CED613|nr:hypothetical protein [Natrononativus amylolyticus]